MDDLGVPLFSSLLGEDSHFDEHIFQMGWFNHQLVKDDTGWSWLVLNKLTVWDTSATSQNIKSIDYPPWN